MRLNGMVHRHLRSQPPDPLRVHLGPGQNNYLDGWLNVDANFITARTDIWADLREKLPFRDATVDAFYSHHVIEHLPDSLLPFHFGELFRCLRSGGAIRMGGPNGDSAIRKFVEGDAAWFSDFPDPHASLGGRFANFLLCRGEHLTILTESYLRELLRAAGFVGDVRVRLPRETGQPERFDSALLATEETPEATPHTLIIEAVKPG